MFRAASNFWNALRCIQGGIAGLIVVSPGIDLFSPLVCAGSASGASIAFLLVSMLIHISSIEDHCNFAASHLLCGLLGALACPNLLKQEHLGDVTRKFFVLWQSLCVITVTLASLAFATGVFALLLGAKILRSKREVKNHKSALILQKHLPKRSFLNRLFHINSQTAHIVPGENYRRRYSETKRLNLDNTDGPSRDV